MSALKLSPQYTTFIHKQALFAHKLLFWRVLTNKCKGQFSGGKISIFAQKWLFLSEKIALDTDLGPKTSY